jgi:hypothetical protein
VAAVRGANGWIRIAKLYAEISVPCRAEMASSTTFCGDSSLADFDQYVHAYEYGIKANRADVRMLNDAIAPQTPSEHEQPKSFPQTPLSKSEQHPSKSPSLVVVIPSIQFVEQQVNLLLHSQYI